MEDRVRFPSRVLILIHTFESIVPVMTIQLFSVVDRAICPTFVHDDSTRIAVSMFGLAIAMLILLKIYRCFK